MNNTLLITGIPRSGTTLATAMLDALPNAVALNEPFWQAEWLQHAPQIPAQDYIRWFIGDCALLRHTLLRGEPVLDQRKSEGGAITNNFRTHMQETRIARVADYVPVARAGLAPDFLLAVKHTGPFLGLLDVLVQEKLFRICAIVRNPVGAIASWRQVPIPLREGRMPGAEAYWPHMRELAMSALPLLEKQVRMYDLMCARLHALRAHITLIRYEDLMAEPNLLYRMLKLLPPATPIAVTPRKPEFYGAETHAIRDAVLRYAPSARHFYSEAEISGG